MPLVPLTSLPTTLDAISKAFDDIDTITTELSGEVTDVQTELNDALAQIPSASTLEEAQAIATRAATSVANLTQVAATLKAVGKVGQ